MRYDSDWIRIFERNRIKRSLGINEVDPGKMSKFILVSVMKHLNWYFAHFIFQKFYDSLLLFKEDLSHTLLNKALIILLSIFSTCSWVRRADTTECN